MLQHAHTRHPDIFDCLTPKYQRALKLYFGLDVRVASDGLVTYRAEITEKHPKLPQAAGRALARLKEDLVSRKSPTEEEQRLSNYLSRGPKAVAAEINEALASLKRLQSPEAKEAMTTILEAMLDRTKHQEKRDKESHCR